MNQEYYSDYAYVDNNLIEDNPVGYAIDVKSPVDFLGKLNTCTGITRILQSIEDILNTRKGSRFFKPKYGSDLYKALMEPNEFVVRDLSRYYIIDALEEWEPRIQLIDVWCEIDEEDPNKMNAHIEFSLKNSRDPISYVYSTNREVPEL